MDISLEFDMGDLDDPPEPVKIVDNSDEIIKDYLRSKINDFKRQSEISQKNLSAVKQQQDECLKYLKETERFDSVHVTVKKIWKRIHNDKWIIGICVENKVQRPAENVNIVLKSNSKDDIIYSVKSYMKFKEDIPYELEKLQSNKDLEDILKNIENSFDTKPKLISTNNLEKDTTIVVTLDLPKFINYTHLELQGIIIYEMTSKRYQIKLPDISLNVNDVINEELQIKLNEVIHGTEEGILSILSTSQVTPVKLILPEGLYRTLEGILQLDCFFAKTKEGKLFVFDGRSHSLNYCMVKIEENGLELITKNDEQLHLLYHHFYKNIPNIVITNENCEQIDHTSFLARPTQLFFEPARENQTILKDFIDSFDKQLIYIEDKIKKVNETNIAEDKLLLCESGDDYKIFRSRLNELEMKTDELFVKCFDKKF